MNLYPIISIKINTIDLNNVKVEVLYILLVYSELQNVFVVVDNSANELISIHF